MAELLIKVGTGANYQDGDVLCAFSDHHISCVHAEHHCHIDHAGKTRDGLRPSGSLAAHLRESVCQYRFERVSRTEVQRVNLWTGERELFGPETMDVPLFLRRRLKHPRHAIFGQRGREIWYGGREDRSGDRVSRVWEKIAEKTGRLRTEEEHRLWPMGRRDIRSHLATRVEDFTQEEAAALVAPKVERDGNGNPLLDKDGKHRELAKRNVTVNWRRDLLDDLGVTAREVMDSEIPIGLDIEVSPGRHRHVSKPQPQQRDRGKLQDKTAGKPIKEKGKR